MTLARRTRRVSELAALLAVAAAAWALTGTQMSGMDAGPASDLGGLGWFAGTWLLMMTAMMLPALAPALPAQARAVGPFVVGYLLVWTAVGVVAYTLIEAVRAVDPGFLGWDEAGRYVTGGVIVAAALYELTPFKAACLRRCRAPRARTRPAHSRAKALGAGVEHGAACVGCCWALMGCLFALGVMSLVWMAIVAGIVTAQRMLPRWRMTTASVALALVALGAGVALAPGSVPGFTEPREGPAHHDMGAMSGPWLG